MNSKGILNFKASSFLDSVKETVNGYRPMNQSDANKGALLAGLAGMGIGEFRNSFRSKKDQEKKKWDDRMFYGAAMGLPIAAIPSLGSLGIDMAMSQQKKKMLNDPNNFRNKLLPPPAAKALIDKEMDVHTAVGKSRMQGISIEDILNALETAKASQK